MNSLAGNNNIDIEIQCKIYTILGLRVMLDIYLADIYRYEAKRLNEQVKKILRDFPKYSDLN
jgi:hypothetical protein